MDIDSSNDDFAAAQILSGMSTRASSNSYERSVQEWKTNFLAVFRRDGVEYISKNTYQSEKCKKDAFNEIMTVACKCPGKILNR